MRRARLDGYLMGRRGIVHYEHFARRVGLRASALETMLDNDLFPEPLPNRLINGSWFIHTGMEGNWWRWLRREATDGQIAEIAKILLEDDAAHHFQDYYAIREGEILRDWLIDATEINTGFRWRRFFCPKFQPSLVA